METKRITKESKYLLDDDVKGGLPSDVERNSKVVITNRFHQSNLSPEIRILFQIWRILHWCCLNLHKFWKITKLMMISTSLLTWKIKKKELQKKLLCKKCHENKIKQEIAHFLLFLEKYEVKLKCDASKMVEEGKFDAPDGILDKNKYLECLISSRHSPLYLFSIYECVDDTFRSCNPFEISSKSTEIASKIIGTCSVTEHTWYVLPRCIHNKTNQKIMCGKLWAQLCINWSNAGYRMWTSMSWTKPHFAQYFHELEKIVCSAQESVKNKSIEKALMEEKTLSTVETKFSIQKDIIPLTLPYGKNTKK